MLELVESIKDKLGYHLPMIVVDDAGIEYEEGVLTELGNVPRLTYVVGKDTNVGISEGRTMGVKMVKTKYTGLFDDDALFDNNTDISSLIELLDTTDAALAGGKQTTNEARNFEGNLQYDIDSCRLHQDWNRSSVIAEFQRAKCTKNPEPVIGFPKCLRCDVTHNFFLAKTADILEVGGWSAELKTKEHKDIFLRLRAQGKKVAVCPEFKVTHNPKRFEYLKNDITYKAKRRNRGRRMRELFFWRWGF